MDRSMDSPSAVVCKLCGEVFTLPEDEVDGNLPRVLQCGHIYCTSCLRSIQCDKFVTCPKCEVESALPEGGVCCLQEDSRTIGLIYTAKINKIKNLQNERARIRRRCRISLSPESSAKTDVDQPAAIENIERAMDEALVQAARNLTQLKHTHQTLMTGLAEHAKRERAQLEMEIRQASDKALHAVQKWREMQFNQLTTLEAQFFTSRAEVFNIEERMKALEVAMQMAREVRRVPFLEQYCTLDKVLETLQAPVDDGLFNMKCVTLGSGISCVFQSESLNQSLTLSLKMEVRSPKHLSQSPPSSHQPVSSNRNSPFHRAEGRNCPSPSRSQPLTPQRPDRWGPGANSHSSRGSSLSPRPQRQSSPSNLCSGSDVGAPDVIIEEFLEDEQEHTPPPTGPELANDKWRTHRRGRNQTFGNKRNVTQWVVVTHIVNPSHFYVCYVAEKRDSVILSRKINQFCSRDSCYFTASDTVETGSMIFVKWKEELWHRATVVEVLQTGCVEAVGTCKVTQLSSVRVFFLDHGPTKTISIQSEEGATESSMESVNSLLRKVTEAVKAMLGQFSPQAIRCSLKDLVPYDLTRGWSKEAQTEFHSVVNSSTVEMRALGQDRDSLLVDLKKAPMDQSSDVPFSVREYLVFIEVARFYSPVTSTQRPLLYYPPIYPKINTELSAVVSHINSPGDFYIQLVDNMESVLLSAKLQECYNATEQEDLCIYCPVIGEACVARYDDKLWYRAQIIGHPGGRKVEVQFVDFGNKKTLSVSDLRKIRAEFFVLPSMAIHCCLSDVIPLDAETWSDACTNRFISVAHQKLVTVVATEKVPRTQPQPVKLYGSSLNEPLSSIADLLVKEELVCSTDRPKSILASPSVDDSAIWDPPLDLELAQNGVDSPDPKSPEAEDEQVLDCQLRPRLPTQLKDLKVRVCHVNSPSSFYVQLTQYDSQLKRICTLVKKECALKECEDVVWKADMYCAAQINGVWERGRICSDVMSSGIAEVIRCDHGNKVKLHVSNLRLLPVSLIGSLALECTLTDIRPAGGRSTWTATACDLFSQHLTGASALMTIKEMTDERPLPVTLFCSNKTGQFVSLADFLASEGLALRERQPRRPVAQKPPEDTDAQSLVSEAQTQSAEEENTPPHPTPPVSLPSQYSHPTRNRPPKPAPRTIMSAEKVTTQLYQPPELPCLGHIQITVSAIGEDGVIYTRTQHADCQLEQLKERIQQYMKTLPRQKPYTWKLVHGCAVIGPDMSWYRGQLLEVLGGHVKVQYVDYGLVESIPVVHVHPILLCEDVPQLCIPCQLHGIIPVGGQWQQDGLALLREMLLNRHVDMQVLELPTDPREPLTVELFLDGLNLNRILCHHQHAFKDRTISAQKGDTAPSPASFLDVWDIDIEGLKDPEEPVLGPFVYPDLPQEGEQFEVRVKHLWTPNELFLWPLEGTTDVEVDGETLDEALSRINRDINDLPRLSSFTRGAPCLAEYSDGQYYRSQLMKITSVEPVTFLVQHVDFGSDDTLPISKLRQMPAELLKFPSRALKVKVAGFKAPGRNRDGNVLPYSPGWSVKAAMDMIDLLHGNIKASVVARDPELTVLLYNEDGELVHLPLVSSGLAEFE